MAEARQGVGASRPSVGQGTGTTMVAFACQHCMQPLKLHSSIAKLDRTGFEDLNAAVGLVPAPASADQDEQQQFPAPLRHRVVTSKRSKPASLEEAFSHADSLSKANVTAGALFDLMSQRAEFDHPLCEECTDMILTMLDEQSIHVDMQNKMYIELLKAQEAAAATPADPASSYGSYEEELAALQKEEMMLMSKLEHLEGISAELKQEIQSQEEESRVLASKEEKYCKEYNEYQRQLEDFYEEQSRIESRFVRARERLERLKKTNVFNDAFHIWHEGHFGTINNFRLGRLPSVPVEWNEINAAWGQTVLLLHTLAVKLGFKFQRYRLVPNGSLSRLECEDEAKDLPLYGSGGFKLFWDKKFDDAMVAFLDCVQQFKDHIESKEPHFKLPYRIVGDKIGDSNGELSIRIQFNQEETWTKALKFMLTNLKWCLAWVCKQMGEQDRARQGQSANASTMSHA